MILSTLDTKKIIKNYALWTAICFVVSYIYELFSYEVYSNYMIYCGCIPLVLGLLFTLLIKKLDVFDNVSLKLYNSFLATFTVGMFIKGVLEIYGTTNPLVNVYDISSVILLFLTIIVIIFKKD